ncbi:thermonuclease family protein [Paenibacillus agaridevorans]|uniref:thermonuclease family protein n=1 Tax=Paenibacillus agaridevorans TaxID=171404 RepID=UPI001BE45489|nr:thermonuclease family protein [Paenibacillus agaridevorans]
MKKKVREIILNNKALNIIAFKIYPLLAAKIIDANCIEAANQLRSQNDESFYIKDISKETIEKLLAKEAERKKSIEDKAKTNVTAVTIAITLVTTILTIINGANSYTFFIAQPLSILLICAVIVGFIYLVISGFSAFRALQLGAIYDIYLYDEKELLGKQDEIRLGRMIKNLELNYLSTPQREAYVTASYQAMKNGIIALVGIVFFGVIIFFSGENSEELTIRKSNSIQIQVLDIIDTNTLKVSAQQIEETVQLAYISSPSFVNGESFGLVAYEAVKEILKNRIIEMEIIDYRSGKKEVLVYIDGNRTLNEYLIENGLAKSLVLNKGSDIAKLFLDKESFAKGKRLGMWS